LICNVVPTAFLSEVSARLIDYHKQSIGGDEAVSVYKTPAQLHTLFERIGVPLHCNADDKPVSLTQLTKALDAALTTSVRSSHPMFLNQLYAGVDPIALAGEWTSR
jgi:glutamate decarboxylase